MLTDKLNRAFNDIKATDAMKEAAAAAAARAREAGKASPRRRGYLIAAPALALAAVALIVSLGIYRRAAVPVSYVGIDINPSMELALDRRERIISAAPQNEDGARVLEGLELEGLRYTEGIETLLESEAMQRYLAVEGAELTFTVAGEEAVREALLSGIESLPAYGKYRCVNQGAELSSISEAHSCGMSLGKYAAYLELAQYEEDVTAEECCGMTVGEIHRRIRRHSHGGASDDQTEHHSSGDDCAETGPAGDNSSGGETAGVSESCTSIESGGCPDPEKENCDGSGSGSHGNGSGNGQGNGNGGHGKGHHGGNHE